MLTGRNWAFVVPDEGAEAIDRVWAAHEHEISYIAGITVEEDGRTITKGWVQFVGTRPTKAKVQRILRRGYVAMCRAAWGTDEISGPRRNEHGVIRAHGSGSQGIHEKTTRPSGRRITEWRTRHLPTWEQAVSTNYQAWLQAELRKAKRSYATEQNGTEESKMETLGE